MVRLTDVELAYFGGIFDGEGCIMLSPRNERLTTFRLVVLVSNTYKPLLECLKSSFGGQIHENTSNQGAIDGCLRRTCYQWRLSGPPADDFLRAISDYSLVKSKQINIALRYYETCEVGRDRGRAFDPILFSKRAELYKELQWEKWGGKYLEHPELVPEE